MVEHGASIEELRELLRSEAEKHWSVGSGFATWRCACGAWVKYGPKSLQAHVADAVLDVLNPKQAGWQWRYVAPSMPPYAWRPVFTLSTEPEDAGPTVEAAPASPPEEAK